MDITTKNWLIPSIAFFLFLYVMVLLAIFAYRDSKMPLFDSVRSNTTTTIEDFKKELNKYTN
ncbi:hypothetical protein [uncultured Helicobacter sp.]|uniref:hypothetical protein n=1 Tax=uncultured Helicobacter sp. TaxID=175537 RepID=UPI001C397766|nr:hypothetical protein [Candidatus Helicobacter avicola]